MEPPAKRLRLSPRDETRPLYPRGIAERREKASTSVNLTPTRTLDLHDLERRRSGQERGIQRNAGIRLLPRVPDVTVTANMVDIAILDGSAQTSYTQISVPTTDLVLPIPKVGTITVPGVAKGTGISPGSGSPSGSPSAPGSSGTGIISSASTSVNSTSTNERTVTVTSMSTLQVLVQNGTVTFTSTSHRRTITTDGITITTDDTSALASSDNGFGGMPLSATTTFDPHNSGAGATATSSSTSDASPTATGGGIVLTPQQQQMVGGVVGGVAGVALVLLGILYFLKWYRFRLESQGRLSKESADHRQISRGGHHSYITPPSMTEISSSSLVPVAALKQSIQKLRPHSTHTLASTVTDRSSAQPLEPERSFHRVSGRKIPSVLLTGGDGYGSQGFVSPTDQFKTSRSREVSQASSWRDSNNSKNSVRVATVPSSISGYSTPPRQHISPFLDPPSETQNQTPLSMAGPSTSVRDFTSSNASRSNLTIQTAGLSALNPSRYSDGNVTIRPSPARTPTTTSPTNSSLRLPMHTPPLMSGNVPEMPPLQPWRHTMGPRKFSDDTLSVQRSMGQRTMSTISARSASSFGGKFKEDI